MAARHDEFTVACSPHLATRGLNVGVLAAKDMFGARDEDAMETETAECAYYDREETASVMSPPPGVSLTRRVFGGEVLHSVVIPIENFDYNNTRSD